NALTAGYTFPAPVTAKVIDTRTASIARAHLARFLAAIAAAILALAIAAFLLRWRALAPAPVPCGTGDGAIRWRALAPRLAVTLGVPAVLIVLARAPLPGVSTSDLMPGLTLARVSILSIGVTPVITAYLLVELAALVIPGWRRRRHAGRDARLPLTSATAALGAALTIVQAWFLADYFVAYGFADDRWTIVAALSAGVLAYALGALAIERWGLGNGWSVVIAAPLIEWIARDVTHAALAPLALALAGGALVAMIALGAARTKIDHARLPLGGVVAAAATPALFAFLVGTVTLIPGGGALAFQIVDRLGQPAAQLLSACVLAALLAALWSRRLAGAARTGAIALSTAIALSVASLELASARATGAALGLAFALTAATIADVIVEARARARASWTELASLHDVDHADELLADGSRTARGLHVRALYRFFAPFVPVTIFERTTDDGRRTTISS
ncbi:MAG TPA: hypothetical protein VL463_22705, partial [Kofleriaceae bacterium]|nr:hypothetical protein [Kofleriaceae bacterium]